MKKIITVVVIIAMLAINANASVDNSEFASVVRVEYPTSSISQTDAVTVIEEAKAKGYDVTLSKQYTTAKKVGFWTTMVGITGLAVAVAAGGAGVLAVGAIAGGEITMMVSGEDPTFTVTQPGTGRTKKFIIDR